MYTIAKGSTAKRHKLIGVVIFCFSCSCLYGCMPFRTYHGIKPVYPKVVTETRYRKAIVDSLQPTFQWEAAAISNTTYDLRIMEELRSDIKKYGQTIYYKENIDGTSHRIEFPLLPDTVYCWQIRPRRKKMVGRWSTYNEEVVTLGGGWKRLNVPYCFKTPKAK